MLELLTFQIFVSTVALFIFDLIPAAPHIPFFRRIPRDPDGGSHMPIVANDVNAVAYRLAA